MDSDPKLQFDTSNFSSGIGCAESLAKNFDPKSQSFKMSLVGFPFATNVSERSSNDFSESPQEDKLSSRTRFSLMKLMSSFNESESSLFFDTSKDVRESIFPKEGRMFTMIFGVIPVFEMFSVVNCLDFYHKTVLLLLFGY